MSENKNWLDAVRWDDKGLVCAIAQEVFTHRVLMVAWMDREALQLTASTGRATYFSRSRNKLWKKGEESGNFQQVQEMRLDCDGDVVLLKVQQQGGIACHTGRHACFYQKLEPVDGHSWAWATKEAPLKDPATLYAAAK
jgi:phosphoribosyl-AMP cyclohydrolase